MQKFFEDYLSMMEERHTEILKALDGLPAEALDWVPGPDMNSISVLVFHTAGSERYWIGDVVAQESSNRDRDAEFKVKGVGVDVLKKRLNDNLVYVRKTLEKFTVQDLGEERIAPRDGRKGTVGWGLLHALEHMTLHLGQIQITRQLWEQKKL